MEAKLLSGSYSLGHHASVLKAHSNRTASKCAAHVLPHVRPYHRILDVGCGPGTITLDLAKIVSESSVIGIDFSPEVVEVARQNVRDRGVKNCEFRVGDACNLDWAEGTFDIVVANQCLIHLPDPVQALKEMKRVCKANGLVAARDGDLGTVAVYPDIPYLRGYYDLLEKVMRSSGGEPYAGRRLVTWAIEAGFEREQIQATASVELYSSPEERRFTGSTYADRIANSDSGRRAVELGFATRKDIENIADAWKEWIGTEDGFFSLTHVEITCRK